VGADGILKQVRQGDIKPELAWNILVGMEDATQGEKVAAAHQEHAALLARCKEFFAQEACAPDAKGKAAGGETEGAAADSCDARDSHGSRADDVVVLLPCTCVEPFDKNIRYVEQIGEFLPQK
jgi:hypothetical protein